MDVVAARIPEDTVTTVGKNVYDLCCRAVADLPKDSRIEKRYLLSVKRDKRFFRVISTLDILEHYGMEEHFNELERVFKELNRTLHENHEKPFSKRTFFSYSECRRCFNHIKKETLSCPPYLRDRAVIECHKAWFCLCECAGPLAFFYCVLAKYRIPRGRYKFSDDDYPNNDIVDREHGCICSV